MSKKVKRLFNTLLYIYICLSAVSPALGAEPDTLRSDSAMMKFLSGRGVTLTHGNSVRLLKSGTDKFDDLFDAIRGAKHYVHLEYFNFRNDSIASLLFQLLEEKSKEGVKVRAMFDAFGNWSNNKPLKKKHLREIRKRGIEIVKYDPLNFPFIGDVTCRDHRKIVIIDGRTAYTGGMNVADYYVEGLPGIGPWRDMHICIEGPAVTELAHIFNTMWEKATGEAPDLSGTPTQVPSATHLTEGSVWQPAQEDTIVEPLPVHRNVTIGIVDRVPRKQPKLMREAYAQAIDEAERRIELINPYFVPTRKVRRALKRAARRGVDVQVMISTKSDIPITPDASFHVARQLHKCGATIYQFNGGFHHSKIMMVDSTFCTVGSTNLNSRSLRYDYEVNAFIFNAGVTDELSALFADDKRQCTIMTDENWKERSRWHRFVGWFANLLTPFL